jgi:homoserine kinase type II
MAVYTEVSFEDLERLPANDIGTPVLQRHRGSIENSNFYLQTDRGAFILTLYEKRVAEEDLPFSWVDGASGGTRCIARCRSRPATGVRW